MDATKLMALLKDKKAALKQKAKTLKPNPGSNRYVLLPGWRKGEEEVWYHDFGQHFVKNAAGEIQAVYVCADKTFAKPCPVCQAIATAMRGSDEETMAHLKEATSAQSYLINVLALDSDDDATPQILQVGKGVFGQILDVIDEWGMAVFDAEAPQIITVNRDGKGLQTKYSVQISPKKHTLPKGVLSKLNNLDEYVSQENEEQQRRAIGAINSVAGLLPPPSDVPRTASSAIKGAAASKPPARDDGDEDLRDLEGSRAAAASKPSAADIQLDDELDALLGEMTGTDE